MNIIKPYQYISVKLYLNRKSITSALLILLFVFYLLHAKFIVATDAIQTPFSFELLVKEEKFNLAKKIDNEYYMLFKNQQFGFELQAKKDGFISLWYRDADDSLLSPYPIESDSIYSVKTGEKYQITLSEKFKVPFYAINIDKTDYYYAIFHESKQKQEALFNKKKLIKNDIEDMFFKTVEVDISPAIPVQPADIKNCKSDEYIRKIKNKIKNKKIDSPYENVYLLALSANTSGLRSTHLDACRFKEVMKALFFMPKSNIRVYKDATRNNFITGLSWLKRTVKSDNDLVILYFSGHGSTYKQNGGIKEEDGYDEVLIMQDQIHQVERELKDADIMIRDNYLYNELSQLPTEQILTVIDSCHAGGTARMPKGTLAKSYQKGNFGEKSSHTPSKYCNSLSGKGVLFAASEEGKLAIELPNGGEFTLALLDTIAESNSNLSLDDIFLRVSGSGNPCIVGERNIIKNLKVISR